jgi:hypothetical protein
MAADKKRFKFRNFTSLTLLFSFIILGTSGIILYIRPEGSIARWIGWSFLGLDKKGWEGLHTLFCFLFLIFSIIHLCYNWKVLLNFLRKKIDEGIKLRKELTASAIFVVLFAFVAIMRWQPFWQIAEWRSTLKKAKYLISVKPPESDFEKKKIVEVAESLNMSTDELVEKMKQMNVVVDDPDKKLYKVAAANKTTSEEIYKKLTNK